MDNVWYVIQVAYIKKFKLLMAKVMRQPEKASKILTLGAGIIDLLDGEED